MRFLSFPSLFLALAGAAAAAASFSPPAPHLKRRMDAGMDLIEHPNRTLLEERHLGHYAGKMPKHPLFVYSNEAHGLPPHPKKLQGWNMFAMCFWNTKGLQMNALTWHKASKATREKIHKQYREHGVKLMVSAFGDSETPTSSGVPPRREAKRLAKWVKTHNVDGVDIDYEDFGACWAKTCAAWVITFQRELRKQLGHNYIITHAPIAPWFTTDDQFGGGYMAIHHAVGHLIDLYLVQFYNQGWYYNSCDQIVYGGGSNEASMYPATALMELIGQGLPKHKLLIGKPATTKDAGSGYTDLATLHQCVEMARQAGWDAGLMAWAWPHAKDAHFVKNVWK